MAMHDKVLCSGVVFTKLGFEVIRIRGCHHFLQPPDGRRTVVPVHAGEIIGPGLLSKILIDAEIEVDDL